VSNVERGIEVALKYINVEQGSWRAMYHTVHGGAESIRPTFPTSRDVLTVIVNQLNQKIFSAY
jgi:reverse gyrase